MSTYFVVAGGSGGHLFPAQALAQELIQRGHTVHLMTDRRANDFAADFPANAVHIIPSATPNLRNPLDTLQAVATIVQGVLKARKIFKKVKPAGVIGFGGYPTFPPLIAASLLKILTILHEQNSVLGRANRASARFANVIAAVALSTL